MQSQKLKKILKNIWLISFTLLLSSCIKITIKDAEWCGDLGADGATCFHTLDTAASRDIAKLEWDKEREGMLCTRSKNFADIKIAIEYLCKQSKECDYETKEKLNAFFKRVERRY